MSLTYVVEDSRWNGRYSLRVTNFETGSSHVDSTWSTYWGAVDYARMAQGMTPRATHAAAFWRAVAIRRSISNGYYSTGAFSGAINEMKRVLARARDLRATFAPLP
jgi:hypothetical protein